jgi:ribonuclease Z
LAVVRRQVPKLVSADPAGDLPDGLHVAIAGSGSPLPDPKRRSPCAAVIAGGRVYVVDTGEGASETLTRMGIAARRIEAVLMTHFHSDHIGGLGTVNLQRWVADAAATPMRVLGPPGVERVVAGINEAFRLDFGYRTAHHGEELCPPASAEMVAEPFADPGEEAVVVLEEEGLKVTAFTVEHPPIRPAVGFRFDYGGRSIVVSGDTLYTRHLVAAAAGADLLVHDALSPALLQVVVDAAADAGQTARSRILADVPDYHATAPQAADAARDAGVGALAITHIVPPLPLKGLEEIFLGDARERFTGPLWLARDGDLYSLPAAGGGVERANLLRRGR